MDPKLVIVRRPGSVLVTGGPLYAPRTGFAGLQANVGLSRRNWMWKLSANAVGIPVNLASPVFSYANADGKTQSYLLPQCKRVIPAQTIPPARGAYRALVEYRTADGQKIEAPLPSRLIRPPSGCHWIPNWSGEPDRWLSRRWKDRRIPGPGCRPGNGCPTGGSCRE